MNVTHLETEKERGGERGEREGGEGGGREGGQGGKEREGEREHSNSNSKTLMLKDSSVWSIWTHLTASPCYTTNTNKHDNTTNKYYKHD